MSNCHGFLASATACWCLPPLTVVCHSHLMFGTQWSIKHKGSMLGAAAIRTFKASHWKPTVTSSSTIYDLNHNDRKGCSAESTVSHSLCQIMFNYYFLVIYLTVRSWKMSIYQRRDLSYKRLSTPALDDILCDIILRFRPANIFQKVEKVHLKRVRNFHWGQKSLVLKVLEDAKTLQVYSPGWHLLLSQVILDVLAPVLLLNTSILILRGAWLHALCKENV